MQAQQTGLRSTQKAALVSGCSTGFGHAIVRELAKLGYRVYAGLRRLTDAAAFPAELRDIVPIQLDVTDAAQVRAAVAAIRGDVGALDVLVNNAGIDIPGALEDLPEKYLREVMEVNFFGALALTRAALPLLRSRPQSAVVMISSLSGLVGLPGSGAYCASKFALEGATESLRHEVARFGVRVALIEPGGYDTAMATKRKLPPDYPATSPYLPLVESLISASSAGPGRDPSDIAEFVARLIASNSTQLRHPAGRQAEQLFERLRTMDDGARQAFVREAFGTGWWEDGQRSPPAAGARDGD